MRFGISMLIIVALWSGPTSSAQTLPPNDMGVSMGHVHLHVRDLEANKKFWQTMGGTPLKIDGTDVMKFGGVFIFLTQGAAQASAPPPTEIQVVCGCPSDGFESSVLNHLGFLVRDFDGQMAKFKAAGLTLKQIPGNGRRQIHVFSPDNVALEVAEGKNLAFPVTTVHFHFFAPAFINEYPHRVAAMSMFEWYRDNFGGKLIPTGVGALFPGGTMRFSSTPLPTAPTAGRTVDHMGFEVVNLEAFSKKLEANHIRVAKPYSKTRHEGFASVELVDPYGVSVELTEGLNKF